MSRIAIVHDYFTQKGGAERVAEELFHLFPSADMLTTVALSDKLSPQIYARLSTSWMQQLPALKDLYRLYFPLYPAGIQALDLSAYDLVISSSSGYAKGVRTRNDALHVCYCHTPMRWVWRYNDYAARESFGLSKRVLLPLLIGGLKLWDLEASRQPDQYVANSQAVAQRIWDCYQRDAVVIPPPIDVHRFTLHPEQDDYYLVLSRLVPYKRIDLAINACKAIGRRLLIVGDGTDRKRLEKLKGPSITFLGRLSDEETSKVASRCRALLFPGEEDFGMVPLELAAAGRPTIAYRAGGALETILDGTTGLFFDKQTPSSLADAILHFETRSWYPSLIREHSLSFDVSNFRRRFVDLLRARGALTEVQLAELALHSSRSLNSKSVDLTESHRIAKRASA